MQQTGTDKVRGRKQLTVEPGQVCRSALTTLCEDGDVGRLNRVGSVIVSPSSSNTHRLQRTVANRRVRGADHPIVEPRYVCFPKLAAAVCAATLLLGCQAPITKVERKVSTSVVPNVYCLVDLLRTVADGKAVRYSVQELGSATAHSYNYLVDGTYDGWWMLVKKDQSVEITHSTSADNAKPNQLTHAQENMLKIEGALQNQCGMGDAMNAAIETCSGALCTTAAYRQSGRVDARGQ